MNENIKTIQNEEMCVQVDLLGASLWSIKDKENTEYLWQGDEKYWGDRAPVLFPYIARLTEGKYLLNDHEYQMDIHGFAKDCLFEIVKQKNDELVLRIRDTEKSYSQYPFQFVFEITYKLEGRKLRINFHVENKDIKTMYFGVGGHPGFNVPLENNEKFEDYHLQFMGTEVIQKELFSDDCFVLGRTEEFSLMVGRTLPLKHELFDNDAIVLSNVPKKVSLKSKIGKKSVVLEYPNMDYLGIWHWPRTDAPYICIEPWSSLPSRKNIVEDLSKQDNLIELPSGDKYDNCWSIELQ